jgi:DNA-binding Lrp family transcriptional regulator
VSDRFDKLDCQIVELLQRDGRLPAATIGRRLGVSERTARFRIDRLVRDGLVVISAWVDCGKAGLPVAATMTIDAMPHLARGVAERLAAVEEIIYVSLNEQAGTIIISIVAATELDARRAADTAVRDVPGILETRVYVETTFLKDLAGWYPRPPEPGAS